MTRPSKTFVLVHGAWHGGWCWARVAGRLVARGHRVTTPTLTGLGERAHLMSPDIDLALMTADLVNHLFWEDLTDVILVGHSFAGHAITGAADQVPARIGRLVYLDAMVPESGRTHFDDLPEDVVAERLRLADRTSGGLSIPAPPAAAFGVTDPKDAAWVESRLTPHPLGAFTTAQTFDNAPGNGLSAEYVLCNDPVYGALEGARARARALDWPITELAAGHDAMVTSAEALADLLEAR